MFQGCLGMLLKSFCFCGNFKFLCWGGGTIQLFYEVVVPGSMTFVIIVERALFTAYSLHLVIQYYPVVYTKGLSTPV